MSFFKELEFAENSNYFRPVKGENRLRLVSAPIAMWTSFDKSTGENVVRKFITEAGAKAFNATAPKESQAKKKYAMYVLDRASDEVLVAEFGMSIMKAIKTLALDSEYGFDSLPNYDIKVTRSGEGLDTEYAVLPTPVKELTEDEQKRIEAMPNLYDFLKEGCEDKDSAPPEMLA